ncbi:hypothetical protein [Bartonella apis]|uniref:hypothetical protein n=1 Tax=Bartonella apis TaxID=1686310 RepID=UPI000965F404|nr:hypothetical protein [Bartonella apis]OLY48931.1 hypothetical protein PEB0122_007000 [Bartonella apis]
MANFAGLLKKTIDAQNNPTPQLRARVYARARETVERKLAETNVPENVAAAQLNALDDAIKSVEADYVAVEQELLSTIMVRKPAEEKPAPAGEAFRPFASPQNHQEPEHIEARTPSSIHPQENADDMQRKAGEQRDLQQTSPTDYQGVASGLGDNRSLLSGETKRDDSTPSNDLGERATASSRNYLGENKTFATNSNGNEATLKSDDAFSTNSTNVKKVPDAEPVNMEDIIAAEKEAEKEQAEKEQQSAKALGNNQQTGDYDIVSDIFVQAAKRTERRAARKRAIVIGLSSAVVIIVVVGVLLTAWSFLSGKNKSHEAESHIAESNANEQPKEKFTQRLLADGSEVDEGPAKTAAKPGEGTSTSAGTTGAANPQEQPGEATFYQARTDQQDEKVETGSVQWSVVKDKATAQHPEEIAVRGNVTIPDEKLSLRLTLRRNTDPSLPAAYLIEAIFIVPDDFEGKAIDNVHELTFKDSEQAPGQQLTGTVEAKIDDDFFLFALSGANPFRDRNLQLMKQLGWIRLVITDKNKRVSELTFSKGPNGEAIFNQVIDSWLNQNNKPTLYDEKQSSDGSNANNPTAQSNENGVTTDNPQAQGQSEDNAEGNGINRSPTTGAQPDSDAVEPSTGEAGAANAPKGDGQTATDGNQSTDTGEEDTE